TAGMRNACTSDRAQVNEHCLVLPGGKTKILRRNDPSAVSILSFERDAVWLNPSALTDGNVDAAVGRIDPTVRHEPPRSLTRNVAIHFQLDVVIPRDPLIPCS